MRPQGSGQVGAYLLVEREHRGGRVAKDQQGDGCSLRNGRRAVKGEERGQEIHRRHCISDGSISAAKEEAESGAHLGA